MSAGLPLCWGSRGVRGCVRHHHADALELCCTSSAFSRVMRHELDVSRGKPSKQRVRNQPCCNRPAQPTVHVPATHLQSLCPHGPPPPSNTPGCKSPSASCLSPCPPSSTHQWPRQGDTWSTHSRQIGSPPGRCVSQVSPPGMLAVGPLPTARLLVLWLGGVCKKSAHHGERANDPSF